MDAAVDRYSNYGRQDQDHYNKRRYSPDRDQRGDKERTRDRERRRERRRRERDRERRDDSRERARYRPRENRHGDIDDRPRYPRGGSQDGDDDGYEDGAGFYEEGGYMNIDHPSHGGGGSSNDGRYGRDGRENGRDRDRAGDRWATDTPTNTILLRGLPITVDEKDIKAELMLFGAPVKDVRLMKRKETGVSRGFAFVEFQNLTDAQRWMDQNQGQVLLLNQHRVRMHYSSPRNRSDAAVSNANREAEWQRTDWTCTKCGYHNFRRRDHCFKCSTTREESDRAKEGDGFDQVGNNPCNTLILRGLDALTIEDNILSALGKLSSVSVKNVKVLRDDLTQTSRGFGFAEFNTLAESSQMLEVIQSLPLPFEVDGKAIIVSYAKNTFSTTMATMSSWSQTSTTTSSTENDYSGYQYDEASGQYYNPTTGQYYDYAAYYAQQEAASGSVTQTQTDSTNAAAAVAQAAIAQAQAAKQNKADHATTTTTTSTDTTTTATTDSKDFPKYPVPDVSTYQYDESSGYYYDSTTGLYYDASSQYYFNSTTNQFMYWDGEKQTYLPAPNQEQAAGAVNHPDKKNTDKTVKKEKEKKEKVKVAKKIAKDMAKWAKSMNAQKEATKEGFRKTFQGGVMQKTESRESASADAGFAILEKVKAQKPYGADMGQKEDKQLMPPPINSGGEKPGLVGDYGGDSDDDTTNDDDAGDVNTEDKLLDWTKLACLLCKRQFPSKEGLQRHQQLSDLHKKNLESLKESKSEDSSPGLSYRDRAKERREKYGRPDPPVPKRQQIDNSAPIPYEQPTKDGLKTDNVGNKLLQKMGWSQGQGLGRKGQGRTEVIETTMRQAQAGLGVRGGTINTVPGANYKDCVKQMMSVRYNDQD